jgi:hypothetical protein
VVKVIEPAPVANSDDEFLLSDDDADEPKVTVDYDTKAVVLFRDGKWLKPSIHVDPALAVTTNPVSRSQRKPLMLWQAKKTHHLITLIA